MRRVLEASLIAVCSINKYYHSCNGWLIFHMLILLSLSCKAYSYHRPKLVYKRLIIPMELWELQFYLGAEWISTSNRPYSTSPSSDSLVYLRGTYGC